MKVLTELLNRNDVLDKVLETEHSETVGHLSQYKAYRDGLYCKENILLSSEDLSIAVGLYIDDFEVCNPLGTSKKNIRSVQSIGSFQIYQYSIGHLCSQSVIAVM